MKFTNSIIYLSFFLSFLFFIFFFSLSLPSFLPFFLSFLFRYSCLPFLLPLPNIPPTPTSYPQSYLPLALSMCPLYMLLDKPSPFCPVKPSLFPSGYCQLVLNFQSFWFCFACLFVLLIRFHL